MKTILTAFILGLMVIPVCVSIACAVSEFGEWRYRRRYRKAWHKFTAEYDAMSDAEKSEFAATREPWGPNYENEQSRYFAKKWQGGFTDEA